MLQCLQPKLMTIALCGESLTTGRRTVLSLFFSCNSASWFRSKGCRKSAMSPNKQYASHGCSCNSIWQLLFHSIENKCLGLCTSQNPKSCSRAANICSHAVIGESMPLYAVLTEEMPIRFTSPPSEASSFSLNPIKPAAVEQCEAHESD